MGVYEERARNLFLEGYNCSQAVLAAFGDKTGLDEETALRIASSMGGGMGRLREVCGAVSGMFLAAGLLYGYSDPKDKKAKAEHYARIQQLAKEFQKENGSIVCRELLGLSEHSQAPVPEERTKEYYKKRPCPDIIACAAGILERYIEEMGD